jgi:hypothetical protein
LNPLGGIPQVPKDEDVFYRIDFTNQDGSISKAPQQLKEKLQNVRVPLWVKLVKVYHLDPSIYFYNETALQLSQAYDIDVPRERGRNTRAEMLRWVGLSAFINWPP